MNHYIFPTILYISKAFFFDKNRLYIINMLCEKMSVDID